LDIEHSPVFVTWRLRGSLPPGRHFTNETLTSREAFRLWDRLLDGARQGPRYMAQPDLAKIVEDALLRGNGHSYDLHNWAIMPNHVHILLTPHVPLVGILRRWKGSTARAINLGLGRTGSLWQEESFDRQVRDGAAFERVARYIENNPVSAGLVAEPGHYRWSSAWHREGGGSVREPVSTGSNS